jgi:deoxyhypusine synthase
MRRSGASAALPESAIQIRSKVLEAVGFVFLANRWDWDDIMLFIDNTARKIIDLCVAEERYWQTEETQNIPVAADRCFVCG